MREKIWTEAAYCLLYEQLVRRFGPYSSWKESRRPGPDFEAAYYMFISQFAFVVGARSSEAVERQIAFSLPIPENSAHHWHGSPRGKTPGLARVAILNIAAALQAGFITNSMLPDLVATRSNNHANCHA